MSVPSTAIDGCHGWEVQWKYLECSDCLQRSYMYWQIARSVYDPKPVVRCADGQDGLCSIHRLGRPRLPVAAGAWTQPLPEGQE